MNKVLKMILTIFMCFSLVACGNDSSETKGEIIVHITINPEFKIYINDDDKVYNVEYLNNDAKTIGNSIHVIGKTCEEAITLLLNETYQQGYLKQGNDIMITVTVSDNISNQMDTWNKKVSDGFSKALSQNNINAEIIFNSQVNNNSNLNTNSNNTIVDDNGTISVFDKDGNLVQVTSTDNNGNVLVQDYDSNGKVIKETITQLDGTIITIDGNGNMIHQVIVRPDGTVIEIDENGNESYPNFANQTIKSTDNEGNIIETTYDDKGRIYEQITTFKDGTVMKLDKKGKITYPNRANQTIKETDDSGNDIYKTYDQDGYIQFLYYEYKDGFGFDWRVETDYTKADVVQVKYYRSNGQWEPATKYHSNGVVLKEVAGVSSHGLTINYYNEKGQLTEIHSVDNYNNPTRIVYNSDGSYTCYTTNKDGSIQTVYFDKNGNEIHK